MSPAGRVPTTPGPTGASLGLGVPVADPPPGVRWTQVLQGRGFLPVRAWFGLALALFGYALVVPLLNQLLVLLAWAVSGARGTFTAFYLRAGAYETPWGLVATHLALGSLTIIALVMVRFWHGRPTAFGVSVQPGMRWRYLLLSLPLAALVLNAAMWLGRIGQSVEFTAPPGWQWWLLAILLCSPLQAAGEEFFFRGYLMQGFGSLSHRPWVGVVASALVFAAFHGVQNVWLFLDRFGFGLLAGTLVLLTGGLEAAIAAHVANNLFAFGYATFMGGVAQTRTLQAIGPQQLAQDLIAFTVIGLVTWWLGTRLRVATSTPSAVSRRPASR